MINAIVTNRAVTPLTVEKDCDGELRRVAIHVAAHSPPCWRPAAGGPPPSAGSSSVELLIQPVSVLCEIFAPSTFALAFNSAVRQFGSSAIPVTIYACMSFHSGRVRGG